MGLAKKIADVAERVLLGSSELNQQEIDKVVREQAEKQEGETR